MPVEPLIYQPIGGINNELAPNAIGDTQVCDATNFLFVRGRAKTRGGATSTTQTVSGAIVYVQNMPSTIGGLYMFSTTAATGAVHLYNGATELTGSGTLAAASARGIVINANILFPMGAAGLVRTTNGTTYAVVVTAPYNYLVGHTSRAVAAYTATYRNRVAWSVQGDETDWSSTGAGTADLSDSSSWITDLGVMNDTLVICRYDGFHFGYPTGSSTLPYRFENKSKEGVGVVRCSTFFDDMLFFISEDDIYMLSQDGLKAIGGGLRSEIMRETNHARIGNKAVQYQGLITKRFAGELGPWYHLAPAFPLLAPVTYKRWTTYMRRAPHFAYNLREDKWHKFLYPGIFGGVFAYTDEYNEITAGVGGEADAQLYWVGANVALETEATLLSKTLSLRKPTQDMRLHRMLLSYVNQGANEVALEASADLNGTRWSSSDRLALGIEPSDGKIKRAWANLTGTGNDFEYKVQVAPGEKLELLSLTGLYEPASEYQGS